MVVGGLLIKAARRLRARGRGARPGGRSPTTYRAYAADARRDPRSTSSSSPTRASSFDDETYRGDAYPAFGWAACVARVDVDLDTGEVHVRDVVAADDVGRVIHPVLAEGQVEGGTLQAVGYATIEEIKLRDGRYLNDRLATYIIPTALDAPRIHDDPRRGAVQRRAARREGGRRAADGRRGAGGRRRDRTTRPASGSATCRRRPERILAATRRRRDAGRRRRRDAARTTPSEPAAMTDRDRAHASTARPVEVDVPGHAPPARRPARGPRPDRHEGGLRRRRVRRVHGPRSTARRSTRASSRSARSTARDRPDGRGARGAPAGPASAPSLDALQAGVPRDRRRPVRDLHARHADGGARLPRCRRRPRRGRDPRGDRRQPVPLHGLHEDRRGDRRRRDAGATAWTRELPVEPPRRQPAPPRRGATRAWRGGRDRAPIAGGTDLMVAITGELGEPPDRMRRPVAARRAARDRGRAATRSSSAR